MQELGRQLKYQHYHTMLVNDYFWKTYDQQEVDWIEEREGRLYGYEMKWKQQKHAKAPGAWTKAYPEATFEVITPENLPEWVNTHPDWESG